MHACLSWVESFSKTTFAEIFFVLCDPAFLLERVVSSGIYCSFISRFLLLCAVQDRTIRWLLERSITTGHFARCILIFAATYYNGCPKRAAHALRAAAGCVRKYSQICSSNCNKEAEGGGRTAPQRQRSTSPQARRKEGRTVRLSLSHALSTSDSGNVVCELKRGLHVSRQRLQILCHRPFTWSFLNKVDLPCLHAEICGPSSLTMVPITRQGKRLLCDVM